MNLPYLQRNLSQSAQIELPSSQVLPRIATMSEEGPDLAKDTALVHRILEGDTDTLAELRSEWHPRLLARLRSRRVADSQAEDLLSDLWGDCVPHAAAPVGAPESDPSEGDSGPSAKPCLLTKYNGRITLGGFLFTVVFRRFLDAQRRRKFVQEALPASTDGARTDFIDALPDPDATVADSFLVDCLKRAIMAALEGCPDEYWLIFQLVYRYRIPQREVGRLWGWKEYETSRKLKAIRDKMRETLQAELRKDDPSLDLSWEEVLETCRNLDLGFLGGDPPRPTVDLERPAT